MKLYYPCVYNKEMMKLYLVVVFHIDNVILTHVELQVVTKYINKLDSSYRRYDLLTVTCGKVHEYLGTILDFHIKDRVSIT